MASDPRIEEILSSLEIIKKKLPNGELEVIKNSIQSLSTDQKAIKEDLEYFKKRLFNPDDGVIVRINKNTDAIERNDEMAEEIYQELPEIQNNIKNLEQWKEGANKALWVIFTALIGLITTILIVLVKANVK
jgi:hypothetical protein